MAKTLEEYLKENPTLKISDADMALGRNNFGALEGIINARKDWSRATTQEEKDAAHQTAENIRKAYGQYSGGVDGMEGEYKPTYQKPSRAADNDNVEALFNKYNNAFKGKAPTWTPQYEAQIQGILSDLGSREPFSYDMTADPLYQQYRDQYIREGRRAMEDTAGQMAALTGGYGSTYGAIAAQQGYDNYLAGLNDRVPQLEQMAYGKYADELADMYHRLGAYQTEENRLYGQYLDALGQFNNDRNFTYGAMQDAVSQNNYENQFDRSVFENDRDFGLSEDQATLQQRQADIENALAIGDYSKLRELGYDTGYLDFLQQVERAQGMAALAKLGGTGGGNNTKSRKNNDDDDNNDDNRDGKRNGFSSDKAYMALMGAYLQQGDTFLFENTVNGLLRNGAITEADYEKFRKMFSK